MTYEEASDLAKESQKLEGNRYRKIDTGNIEIIVSVKPIEFPGGDFDAVAYFVYEDGKNSGFTRIGGLSSLYEQL